MTRGAEGRLYRQEMSAAGFDAGKERAAAQLAMAFWRGRAAEPLFRDLMEEDGIDRRSEETLARIMAGAKDIVVIGIGGAISGPAVFCSPQRRPPRLHWLDTPDPAYVESLFSRLCPEEARLLIVSKSGATPETLALARAGLDWLGAKLGARAAAGAVAGLCAQERTPLHALAAGRGFALLSGPPGIDSRFCLFTILGLAPLIALGGKAERVRAGGRAVLARLLSGAARAEDFPPAAGAALLAAGARAGRIHVTMAGAEHFAPLTRWWRQIAAESLGKAGKGALPATARLPADQHSQFQLYLDGPDRCVFTLITGPETEPGGGGALGRLLAAQNRAAISQLRARGRVLRILRAGTGEESLGALAMHFLLEILLAARIMGVNPFGQPAVEAGKAALAPFLAQAAEQDGERS